MSIYATVEFTVIDQAKYDATEGSLWFEFLGVDGQPIEDGASSSDSIGPVEGSTTRFVQRSSLQAEEILPKKVTLRGYNAWEKNRYEAHTFEMQ